MGEFIVSIRFFLSALIAGSVSTTVAAHDQIQLPQRNEVLHAALGALDGYLPDARAMRDARLCEPSHIKRSKDGSIKGYTLSLQLNSPTSEGGMSGRRLYYIIVRDGRGRVIDGPYQPAKSSGEGTGIDGLLGDKAARDIEACQRVSTDEIKEAFAKIDGE